MSRYESHVIKIQYRQNKGKWIFSTFSQELKMFPNLFQCVYIKRWLEKESKPKNMISQNTLADLKRPKGNFNLNYG